MLPEELRQNHSKTDRLKAVLVPATLIAVVVMVILPAYTGPGRLKSPLYSLLDSSVGCCIASLNFSDRKPRHR